MSARAVATTIASARFALGAALLIAPDALTRLWLGQASPATRVLARALGARDAAVAMATLATLDTPAAPRWAAVAAIADGTDALATAATARNAPPLGRWGTVALATVGAGASAWLSRALRPRP